MLSKKLSTILGNMLLFLCAIIIFSMLILTLNAHITSINTLTIIFTIIVTLLVIYISIKINRYSPKSFIFILLLISFIQYVAWNIYANTNPVSDYKVIMEGANRIINGTFYIESFDKTNYFYFYNYQIGYSLYAALIIKIFGSNLLWFKILEGLYITFTSLAIYKISNKMWSRDSAAIASILFSIYIPNILGSSIINNQHLSTLALSFSLYFLIKDTKSSIIFSGILLAIAQILRPISIIVIIAILIVYIYNMLKEKNFKKYFKKFSIIIITFIIITKGFDVALMKLNISPGPISISNAKYFKFILGLKGDGVYNIPTQDATKTQVYFDLKTLNFDYDKYNTLCLQVINDCLKDYKNTVPFVMNKMNKFMGGKDNQYEFALDNNKLNNYIYLLTDIGQVQYTLLLLFTFGNIILWLKSHRTVINIFYVLIIGFVLVHIFIEVQTRYRYELYVFFSILSAQFLSSIPYTERKDNEIDINLKEIDTKTKSLLIPHEK